MTTFKDFEFNAAISEGISHAGYEKPTPIQRDAIPQLLQGHDVVGIAQTGTGKTAAFVLPMLQRLSLGKPGTLRALIVGPTRELAEQIQDNIKLLGVKTRLKSATIYGGVGINPQIQALRQGVDIVVACPGRLLDHMQQRTINLSNIEMLVLDEADQMFDMGFLPSIERIIRALPQNRQTMLFSATMPPPIRALAGKILTNPKTVQVGTVAPAETVSHAAYPVRTHLKTALLLDYLKQTETNSVLVFMRTKHKAKKVALRLEKEGYKAVSLQGNLSQNKRQAAMDGFRSGEFKILVATDIAARGIDVTRVSHVINYDVPETAETYTHRIGRTGRAEKLGEAITFVSPDDAGYVRDIERLMGKPLPKKMLEGFDYAAAPSAENEFAREPAPFNRGRRPQRPAERPRGRSSAPAGAGARSGTGPRRSRD
jgi:ATP-dependent RNA helicase RhlE